MKNYLLKIPKRYWIVAGYILTAIFFYAIVLFIGNHEIEQETIRQKQQGEDTSIVIDILFSLGVFLKWLAFFSILLTALSFLGLFYSWKKEYKEMTAGFKITSIISILWLLFFFIID